MLTFSNKIVNAKVSITGNELILVAESEKRIILYSIDKNGQVLDEKEVTRLRQSSKRLDIFESHVFILVDNELLVHDLVDMTLLLKLSNVSHFLVMKKHTKGREIQLLVALENDYVLHMYDLKSQSLLYWTFSGDAVTSSQSVNSKDCFLVGSSDEDIRFYKREVCLGEVHLTQTARFIIEVKDSLWSFGFATKNWIGFYKKTALIWKHYSPIDIYYMSGVNEVLVIGFDDLHIDLRDFSSGDLIKTLTFDSLILDCTWIHSSYYFILASGVWKESLSLNDTVELMKSTEEEKKLTSKKDKCIFKELQSKKDALLKEIAAVSEANQNVEYDFKLYLDSKGNLAITSQHIILRIIIESPILKEAIYLPCQSNIKESILPLKLKNKSGTLFITLLLQHSTNQKLFLLEKQLFVPRFHYYQVLEESLNMELPKLQATLSWTVENPFDPHDWIKTHFLSKPSASSQFISWIHTLINSNFSMEILSNKIKLYSQHSLFEMIQHISDSNPYIQIHIHFQPTNSILSNYKNLENARLNHHWEEYMRMISQLHIDLINTI